MKMHLQKQGMVLRVFGLGAIAAVIVAPAAPGTYRYHCAFHPWMKATLTVIQ